MVEWKSEGIEKNLISLLLFGWNWKSGGMKKYICKYLHIPLLKNEALLKQKKKQKSDKKKAITQIY